jgi:hypothetical protein
MAGKPLQPRHGKYSNKSRIDEHVDAELNKSGNSRTQPASRMAAARPAYVREHLDIMRYTKKIEDLYDDILPTSTRTARKRQSA